jgi:hypothetical protein
MAPLPQRPYGPCVGLDGLEALPALAQMATKCVLLVPIQAAERVRLCRSAIGVVRHFRVHSKPAKTGGKTLDPLRDESKRTGSHTLRVRGASGPRIASSAPALGSVGLDGTPNGASRDGGVS